MGLPVHSSVVSVGSWLVNTSDGPEAMILQSLLGDRESLTKEQGESHFFKPLFN